MKDFSHIGLTEYEFRFLVYDERSVFITMEFLSEMETFQVLLQTSELPDLSITANSSFSSFMNLSKAI